MSFEDRQVQELLYIAAEEADAEFREFFGGLEELS